MQKCVVCEEVFFDRDITNQDVMLEETEEIVTVPVCKKCVEELKKD